MTELKRWLHDSPPDAIARLLASAQHEKAPSRVLRRTLVALGASSVTATAVGAAASTGVAAPLGASLLGIIVKWGGAGLVGGTLVAGGIAGVQRLGAPSAKADAPVSRVAAAAPMNPSPELPSRARAPVAQAVVQPAPSAVAAPLPARVVAPAPVRNAESSTAGEVELVDAARARLRAGDGAAVLGLLARYEADFAPAHFEPEVLYLRMLSSVLLGDRAGAKRLAELIVDRYPQSPGVWQAEELLRASEKPDTE